MKRSLLNKITRNKFVSKSLYEYINLATLSVIGYIIQALPFLSNVSNKTYILCYHSVADSGWRFSTGIRDFEEQIKFLKSKFKIISLEEMLKNKKGLVITFDDSYLDVYENALPILIKYNIKATLFALGNVVAPNREKLQNNLELMNYSHYKKLNELGWEIGFHTSTHPNLKDLSNEQVEKEIGKGKRELEKNLGFKLRYFAYPLGVYNQTVLNTVKKAGFEAAFTINGGEASFKDKFLISRVGVEGNTNIVQFRSLVSSIGIAVEKIYMSILRQKENSIFRMKK